MLKILKYIISFFLWKLEAIKFYYYYESLRRKYRLPKSFIFNGPYIQFYDDGEIIIGENSYIGNLSTIEAYKGCKVEIGANCQISHNVRMYTATMIADEFIQGNKVYKQGNIKIGNNCWIGANVFINPGVTIVDYVVIGANSVVTKDIPSYSIAVGAPYKVIKQFDGEQIKRVNNDKK